MPSDSAIHPACPPARPPTRPALQELRWLLTCAWNRSSVHARFGRAAEAAQFGERALALLAHDAGLEAQYGALMRAEVAAAAGRGGLEEGGSP